jgi:GNAT superfamily N-acetyltransferase
MLVRQASVLDLDELVPLFDAYRRFYGRSSDLQGARAFLLARFEHQQSVVFLARSERGEAVGFTQLYPSFSSTAMARTFVLNDLFVDPGARRGRVGWQLLEAAAAHARAVGAVRLTLSTGVDNLEAKALYRANGWQPDEQFHVFQKLL